MSKELTEQWQNGTLEDEDYYVKIDNDIIIDYYFNEHWNWIEYEQSIKEVLAPVPTYDQFVDLTEKANQFSQMVKKVERLEQLLESETLAKQEGVELVAELEQKVHILEELSQEGNELNAKLVGEYLELEKRLKEANKTLMYVAAMMTCDPADMLETYPDFCADQWALDAVNKYLEKYGV